MIFLIILDSTLRDLLDLKGVISIVLFQQIISDEQKVHLNHFKFMTAYFDKDTFEVKIHHLLKRQKHTGIRRPLNTLCIVYMFRRKISKEGY